MIDAAPQLRPEGQLETASEGRRARVLAIRLLNYATNHLVCHLPSFRLRHAWYRRALGIDLRRGAAVHLGCYFWFYGPSALRRSGLVIGEHTRVNRKCLIDARGPVRIGDNVSISAEVVILTAQHRVNDPSFRVESKPVVVEDNVWVGMRALILPGVTLGRGSVVAAGAVVTRSVPPLAIVAGVPARQVGERAAEAAAYTLEGPLPLFE